MTIIEVVLLVLGVVAALIAIQAHRDHLSFKDEAKKDIAALESEVAALKAKYSAPAASVPPVAPPPAA